MQYVYYYTTRRKIAGHMKFHDLLEAVQCMNKHSEDTFGLLSAEIWDIENDKLVCSKRKIK